MAVVPLVINTVTMPAPSGVVWDILDVLSDAGETTDALGYTHKDILAQKRWLQVRWTAVSVADMATIMSTVNPGPYVQVTALDPMTGASRTMTATVSKRTAPMYNETLGLYESLTVEFTETGVAYTAGDNVEVTTLAGTTIPAGYYNGSGKAVLSDAEAAKVVAGNIASGVTILGVEGSHAGATPYDPQYTRVTRTNNQDVGKSTYTAIIWENEINDDLGAWASGEPTRFTIPSGISFVKITAYVCFVSNNSDYRYAKIRKNGTTDVVVSPTLYARYENGIPITTGWMEVSAGDYFELMANAGTSGVDVLGSATYPGPVFAVMEGV